MLQKMSLTVALVMMITACGEPTSSEPIEIPDGRNGVILEISDEGGFVPIEFSLQNVPRYTVFSDGTLVTPGGTPAIFPGPAVRTLEQHVLSDDVLADLLAFVADMGLDEIVELDLNDGANVADAPTTTVRFFDGGGEHRISIYALGFTSGGDGRSLIVGSMITCSTGASPPDRESNTSRSDCRSSPARNHRLRNRSTNGPGHFRSTSTTCRPTHSRDSAVRWSRAPPWPELCRHCQPAPRAPSGWPTINPTQ